jgi:CDGSH-type Zn-finger protein
MSEVTIRCRLDGPLVIEGAVRITDSEGNIFPLDTSKPAIALCRCGHSAKRPFCDGSHRGAGFRAGELAPTLLPPE